MANDNDPWGFSKEDVWYADDTAFIKWKFGDTSKKFGFFRNFLKCPQIFFQTSAKKVEKLPVYIYNKSITKQKKD
jgi:hypothetical protein